MLSQGYKRSDVCHCAYTKHAKDGTLLILILYVDDMLISKKTSAEISALKSNFHENFDMKDMYEASHILGMNIFQDRCKKLLHLFQFEYIEKVLKYFNMESSNTLNTPLPLYVKLSQRKIALCLMLHLFQEDLN